MHKFRECERKKEGGECEEKKAWERERERESGLNRRYFPGSHNYNSAFNLPEVTKVMPAATSRALPIQCIRKELRQMNATLVTFPGILSRACRESALDGFFLK